MYLLTTMRQTTSKTPFLSYLARVGLLAVIYIVGGRLGLALASVKGIVTLVWPPTGIALAALLLFGYRLWPGVFLGAFLVNLSTGAPLATVIGISIGNTLEAVAGVYLLRSMVGFRSSLERLQDVLNLLGAVAISAIVSATMGTASLGLTGVVPWAAYGSTWWVWWLGDALGALVMAPVLLTWGTDFRLELTPALAVSSPVKPLESKALPQQPPSLLEALALIVSLIAISQIAFGGWFAPYLVDVRLSFILLPFLVWAAIRFGQRGAVTATLIGMGIAVWGTANGFGPFVLEMVHLSLIFLGSFMGAAAVMAMLLAAVLAERQRVEKALRESQERLLGERSQLKQLTETLEELVEQRTAQVRTLASVLTLAEQQERNRISQILHDDLQ
jgi:integral membrane sensor domain MASE1